MNAVNSRSIFIAYFLVFADAGPNCFDCTRLPFPRDCDHVTRCGDHEVCHIKQIVSHSGHIFYNSGCLDKVRCVGWNTGVVNDNALISEDEPDDVVTCLQCCIGDYCNTQGCNSAPLKPYPSARGPLCFYCQKGTALPGDCETVVVCGQDEHCSIEEIIGIGGDKLYKTGCKKCDTDNFMIPVGKRSATNCSGCCYTELCNNNCNSIVTSTPLVYPTRQTTVMTSPTTTLTTSLETTDSQSLPFPMPTMYSKEEQCRIVGYRYLKIYDKCFNAYSNLSLTWQKARDKCIQDNGDLVIFHDKPEEFYFESWLLNLTSSKSRYWVGASDLAHEGTWLWVDSTSVDTKLYFHPGEPNDAGYPEGFHENCAAATYFDNQAHRILLNDDNCSVPSNFICEISFTKICPDKSYLYSAVVGMCFKIYTSLLSWQQAQYTCHSEHATLVETNMESKIKFFDNFLRTVAVVKTKYWVGGKQSQNDRSVFKWQTTQQTIARELWHAGEPNSDSEQCVALHYYNRQGLDRLFLLNDLNCDDKNAFICQYVW